MKNKLIFKTGIMLVLILTLFATPAAADNYFYFDPQDSSANQGEEVTVKLWAHTDVILSSIQCHVDYKPGVVNVTNGIEEGTDWDLWSWSLREDPDYGAYLFTPLVNFGGTATGDVLCGTFTLEGINPGVTSLDVIRQWQPGESQPNSDSAYMRDMVNDLLPFYAINGTFTCTGDMPDTFEKELLTGWNLVSMPLTPSDNHISAILSSIDGKYDLVKKYTGGSGFADTTIMDPGNGYFIRMTEDATWTYDGISYDSISNSMSNGLHCIGWVNSSTDIPDALSSIDGSYRYVARWNASIQDYEVYEPHAPAVFNDFDTMDKGVGYFLSATTACTLTYP